MYEQNDKEDTSARKKSTSINHRCGYCLKTFKTTQELRNHSSRAHAPKAPIVDLDLGKRRCPHCGQKFHFGSKSSIDHVIKAHISSCFMNKWRQYNKEPLHCPHCGPAKRFMRKANLLAHIRNKHNSEISSTVSKSSSQVPFQNVTNVQTLIDQIQELENDTIDPLLLLDIENASVDYLPQMKMDAKRLHFRFSDLAQKMAQNGWFLEVLSNALSYLIKERNLRSTDFVSVALESPEGKLLDYPLVSAFYKGEEWMADVFLNRVQNVLQSHSSLGMNSDLILTITTVDSTPDALEAVGSRKNALNSRHFAVLSDFLARKQGVIDVRRFQLKTQNFENTCLPLCVAMCLFCDNLNSKKRQVSKWWRQSKVPIRMAVMVQDIYNILGLMQNTEIIISSENLELIQCWLLSKDKQLIVTKLETANFPDGAKTIYSGPAKLSSKCHLLIYKQHTFWVENEKVAFGKRTFCSLCSRYVKNVIKHGAQCPGMPKKCPLCHTVACFGRTALKDNRNMVVCNACYRAFYDPFCLNQHRQCGICEQEQRCSTCFLSGTPTRISQHLCYYKWCRACRDYVPINDHKHYVTPILSSARIGIAGKQVCEYCILDFEISNACAYCGWNRQMNFVGPNCMMEAIKFMLFHESNKNAIAIAHYASGYDSLFCLKALLSMGHMPEKGSLLVRNLKILSFIGGGCRVQMKDSFLWFRCRLAALPKMMGLDIEKMFFPHALNREDMLEYRGEWPSPEQYNVREEDREKFMDFCSTSKANNPVFVFHDELIRYCAQDVRVLHQSCARFRQIIMEFDGVDPLTRSISIAHLTSIIFRSKYLQERSIAIITDRDCAAESTKKQSHLALKFLSYLQKSRVPDLEFCHLFILPICTFKLSIERFFRHAGNSRERVIGRYSVDGYSPSQGIFEVLGCMWHGCLRPGRHPQHKGRHCIDKHLSWEDVNHRTFSRIRELEKFAPVHIFWECEIEDDLKTDVLMQNWFSDRALWLDLLQPIHGRDALYGRTGASVCLLEIPANLIHRFKCHYYDINSLYPYCMCRYEYPVGWPEIINGYELPNNGKGMSAKILSEKYFGLIRCRVLAPQNLLFGALPWRSPTKGLLLFPLCLTCAENMDHSALCTHTPDQRILDGCWTTQELLLALNEGYIVEHIHQIWHWPEKSDKIFEPYLKKYGALKYKYGGIPASYDGDKVRYLSDLFNREGIKLDPHELSSNGDYYAMAKNLINNLWGKLAQSSRKCSRKVDFLSSAEELRNVINNPMIHLANIAILDDKAMIETETIDEWIEPGGFHNPVLASFVTSYGRIELYRYLKYYGKNTCYWDTDSVIFLTDSEMENGPELPNVSPFWGDMKSELIKADDCIVKFVSLGAKNYLWQSNFGQSSFKCKGISMSGCAQGLGGSSANDYINFDTLKAILLNNNEVLNTFYDNIPNRELGEKLKCDGLERREKTGGMVHLVLPQPQIVKRWKADQPIYNDPDRTKAIRLSFDKRQLRYNKSSEVISICSTEWGYLCSNDEELPLVGRHPLENDISVDENYRQNDSLTLESDSCAI